MSQSSPNTQSVAAFDMSGTRMLITGAAGGIGQATAKLCGQLGATIVLSDFVESSRLDEIANQIKGVVATERCDVTKRDAVEAMVKRHGPFTALADTAGVCPYDDDWMSPDWNETAFQKVIQVNVLGPINLARAVMPGMIERKYGRIALCGSIAGWAGGLRAGPHYAASKGGVHALVRWLAQRATPHNVTVNGVAPGPIETGMTATGGYDVSKYPMKRMGQPEEIASMLTYLCSPGAGFVAGAIMDVNGGTLLR
ncbi:SDR family oxidoreductase [Orrella sp. NBD-18]|uniref:SDR family oxidoreductase n=1 Tax=Sheuella amnicola TaxID=2707330 RepID=A0A6B2R2K5_9BURK|nr:SDR family NAD(P)-dependent oxidoreductase [Sheuella amnicola]NDY83267.1 SDR family oxidoreductase [Sheuella amnicola]HBI82569.1 NAD(P)-dependent oxidoreductase [Alcaligenaceae bacterium]